MSYIEYVTADHQPDTLLEDLARTNGFTISDLIANRGGKIGESQRAGLVLQALRPIRFTAAGLAVWVICCIVAKAVFPEVLVMIAEQVGLNGLGALFVVITLMCGASFVVSLAKSVRTLTRLAADLKEGKAAVLEGLLSPSREEAKSLGMARLYGQRFWNLWYVMGSERFEVDRQAHGAVREGGEFRLYYTPRSRLLLSLEPK